MFRLLLSVVVLMIVFSCKTTSNNKSNQPVELSSVKKIALQDTFTVADSTKDGSVIGVKRLGTIKQGELVEVNFALLNNSSSPLVVTNLTSTCGCTDVSGGVEPIKVGETSIFTANYNSNREFGSRFVNISIVTNKVKYVVRLEVYVD